MSIIKFYEIGQLDSAILNSICNQDLERMKDILHNNSYDKLTKKEKEEAVFYTIYQSSNVYDVENFFRYIIFDYKISEENSIANIPDLNDKVKSMFELRRTNEELSSELNISEDKNNKKMKI